jgi:hypothetical protein
VNKYTRNRIAINNGIHVGKIGKDAAKTEGE